jgi:hypothetical protein
MHLRAIICCFLLLGQSLAAFATAVQTTAEAEVSAAHCEAMANAIDDMAGQMHQRNGHDSTQSNTAPDCIDSCDECTSCAPAAAITVALLDNFYASPDASQAHVLVMPPGETGSLFRPPI